MLILEGSIAFWPAHHAACDPASTIASRKFGAQIPSPDFVVLVVARAWFEGQGDRERKGVRPRSSAVRQRERAMKSSKGRKDDQVMKE